MFQYANMPVALTIAGSDSGGGAGIQADMKTFAALGVYGTTAITAITAQNPEGVTAIQAIDPDVVAAQIKAVGDYFSVGCAKTGMLFSVEIIEAVADAFRNLHGLNANGETKGPPLLVVDPVMVASSGAKLLKDDAIDSLRQRIIPMATLVTPNMDEAAILSGREVKTEADLEPAARAIYDKHGVPVLVKGGHLAQADASAGKRTNETVEEVVDCLFDGKEVSFFRDPLKFGLNTHGTGCTLSAAIAVKGFRGFPLKDAVSEGRYFLQQAMAQALPIGKSVMLNHQYDPIPLERV